MKLEELLNEEQLKAVKHKDGPLLILAGAGSGKTRVITYRVAYLISEYNIKPENILAVTFTNKAAQEMKERIKKLIGKKADKLQMGTFHSFGVKILRKYADKLGYTKEFSIYDEDDRERLIKECMFEANISDKVMKPYEIIREIQFLKNDLVSPEEYISSDFYGAEKSIIAPIYELYEKKLKQNNAMDFDDLIIRPIQIFKDFPDVLQRYQEQYKYILIDEYQDINNSQYTLISLIAEKYKNICVVGDDDQSIYRFRGADITNILEFENDYKDAKVIRLEKNYRSTKKILKAAHSVIKNNVGRKDKELWTENEEGENILFYFANDEIDEAENIVREINKILYKKDASLKDMAIFYRTNAQSRIIEDRLRRYGIPYKLIGGIQFYGRMEIKDLIAYLRIVVNPYDIVSLKRIINIPPRGIGDTTIEKISKYAAENNKNFFDVLDNLEDIDIKESQKYTLKKFSEFIKELNSKKNELLPSEVLNIIIENTGYLRFWEEDSSLKAKERIENIKELVSALKEYESEKKDISLEDFLSYVSLVSDIDKWDKEVEAVTLMTLHSAKGLEFDFVFITGMEENIFPHKNSLEEDDGIEEERRLCYVGITRAKKRLYLSATVSRRYFGNPKFMTISRFIKEIPQDIIDFTGRTPADILRRNSGEENFEDKEISLDIEPQYDMPDDIEIIYRPGDKVKHKKFGAGVISKIEPIENDFKLTINFKKYGKKVLSARYANLEKLNY